MFYKKTSKIMTSLIILVFLFVGVGCSSDNTPAKSTGTPQQTIQQDQVKQVKQVEPAKPAKVAKVVEPVKPTKPVEPTKPAKVVKPHTVPSQNNEQTVYTTNTGSKYHRAGCRYLRKSSIPITKSKAINEGLTPCSKCNP